MDKLPCFGDSSKHETEVTLCNLVLMGANSVGKTILRHQFLTGTFRQEYVPTTLETFVQCEVIDGKMYQIHLCDSSGSSEFSNHRAPYITEAHGLIFVYSTTDMDSLLYLLECARESCYVRQQHGVKRRILPLLVGTKTDDTEHHAVTMQDAERIAKECLLTLGVKLPKGSNKGENGGSAGTVGGRSQLPVLEISCTQCCEVFRAMRVMIRMACYFRTSSFWSGVQLACPNVEPRRLVLEEVNVATQLEKVASDASLHRCFTPVTAVSLREVPHNSLSLLLPCDTDATASYTPKSVGVTQSVFSSGADEEETVQKKYMQQSVDSAVIVRLPPWILADGPVNVLAGGNAPVTLFASEEVSEKRALKVDPSHRQCPICQIM
ncbi:putative small GTP-binding protein RAB6 [Trypanosoma rangeli]|uniref:Putative small GTP-binding protein RAB6 n=1 Tax=Trypanosoma rangeli TaxID=5698 RepID=A0A422NLM1_TRYRA|nr:putative small GTP-binding protein RAB6 [Trypanosoma rangeli]RNF06304.1 putative small GTP-binding protein RAB6 [Trypanosoma rangeli]|eukprot:RNF06304.1 putative small GTP-binding protein RAB6 [Trypanosoma rangeli]